MYSLDLDPPRGQKTLFTFPWFYDNIGRDKPSLLIQYFFQISGGRHE